MVGETRRNKNICSSMAPTFDFSADVANVYVNVIDEFIIGRRRHSTMRKHIILVKNF